MAVAVAAAQLLQDIFLPQHLVQLKRLLLELVALLVLRQLLIRQTEAMAALEPHLHLERGCRLDSVAVEVEVRIPLLVLLEQVER